MSRFRYSALTSAGSEVKGFVDALTADAARETLLRDNLEVEQLVPARRRMRDVEIVKRRVTNADLMNFSREMSAFVRAGLSLTDGLQVIANSTSNKRWQGVLVEMREAIAQGSQFSEVLAEHADILPAYYLGIVRSAELTGRLDEALEQLSEYLERDLDTRNRIMLAMAYPSVVLVAAIATIGILTTYVLPKFATFFKGLGAKLPTSTRMLIDFADFTKRYWWGYAIVLLALVAFALYLVRTVAGRRLRNRIVLHLPVLGEIARLAAVERICRVLGAMTKAAVPLPDAVNAAIESANNAVFEEALHAVQERMLEGEGLAQPMADTGLFPEAAVQMLRVGENTGTVDQQLDNASRFYGRQLEARLKHLTTLFEPAVIVIMGIVVGFVAIALVQAMYGIYRSPSIRVTR